MAARFLRLGQGGIYNVNNITWIKLCKTKTPATAQIYLEPTTVTWTAGGNSTQEIDDFIEKCLDPNYNVNAGKIKVIENSDGGGGGSGVTVVKSQLQDITKPAILAPTKKWMSDSKKN